MHIKDPTELRIINLRWVRHLGTILQQRRLDVFDQSFKFILDDVARSWSLQHMLAALEVIIVIDQWRGSANEWWELYDRAAKEVEQETRVRIGIVNVVGRKDG